MSMRKIIQIVACGEDATVLALCDDGSVWNLEWDRLENIAKWVQEPDIPQDEVVESKLTKTGR